MHCEIGFSEKVFGAGCLCVMWSDVIVGFVYDNVLGYGLVKVWSCCGVIRWFIVVCLWCGVVVAVVFRGAVWCGAAVVVSSL